MKRKDIATKLSKMSPEKPFLLIVGQEQVVGSFIILATSAKIYARGNNLHMWWDTVSTQSAWGMKAFGKITFMANLSSSEAAGLFNTIAGKISSHLEHLKCTLEDEKEGYLTLIEQWKN